MPDFPKPRRRLLKMELETEAQLERLVRSLERIATGLESVLETLEAVSTTDSKGDDAIRTVSL